MSNLFDYLEWRGDLTFEQDPFHDLDALVLSQISYFTFEKIMEEDEHLTLAQAWEEMKDGDVSSRFVEKSDKQFFEKLVESRRYKDLEICHMSHKQAEEEIIQFAAMTFLLPDGTPYIGFRGTDVSFVGWKEDLYMAFSDSVPAQLMAVDYLKKIVELYQRPLYVGGHSKGGNLAMYSAVSVPEEMQNLIKMVYVHDGPGLKEELFHSESYARLKDRLQVILPDQSMVGILMMHPEEYYVVKSSANSGVMQHNPYSWQVMGTHYVLAEGLKKESHYVETVTKKWVEENNEEELRGFVESMFEFLQSSETESMEDLVKNIRKNPKMLIHAFRDVDEEKYKAFKQTMSAMAGTAIHEATSEIREATSEIKEKGIDLTLRNAKKILDLLPGKNHEETDAESAHTEPQAIEEKGTEESILDEICDAEHSELSNAEQEQEKIISDKE